MKSTVFSHCDHVKFEKIQVILGQTVCIIGHIEDMVKGKLNFMYVETNYK